MAAELVRLKVDVLVAAGVAAYMAKAAGRQKSAEEMVAWLVSPRVGNVKNNDASLIEPIVGRGIDPLIG